MINIEKNHTQEMLINDLNKPLSFTLEEDAKLILKLAITKANQNADIKVELRKNANLEVIYADFSKSVNQTYVHIDLLEEGAKVTWNLVSLATDHDNKKFDISFIHHAKNTIANMQNYGVALNASRLVFSGINYIKCHASKSSTNQNAKIIVFDQEANARANPILKIDENDVLASHSAIVGRLNDEHLFYLKSRGLTEQEAKALIVYGYLKPISQYFDTNIQNEINQIIQEKCHV